MLKLSIIIAHLWLIVLRNWDLSWGANTFFPHAALSSVPPCLPFPILKRMLGKYPMYHDSFLNE